MTTPVPSNGAVTRRTKAATPETFHGFPVLPIRVDDPIPTPRAPERYAIRVTPDLARYFLTFNHPDNRKLKELRVQAFVADMRAGLWEFTFEPIAFDVTGRLNNGQNRLTAVTAYGEPVTFLVEFGWPETVFTVIDRGAPRSNGDTAKISGIPQANNIASAISHWKRYDLTVGTVRSWQQIGSPTSRDMLAIYESDPEGWHHAITRGASMSNKLDRSLSPSLWAASFRVLQDARPGKADEFFDEVYEGSGTPRSASRDLRDFYIRRSVTATLTGDRREPIEIAVRAFNGWLAGRTFAKPRYPGFTLSRVK
jgi:hypothetical protein